MSARSRDVQKIITIGLVGSAPHIREVYSYQNCLPFFSSATSLQPERKYSHQSHNASIDANFLKEVRFGGPVNTK
jgi:hypothetical protein